MKRYIHIILAFLGLAAVSACSKEAQNSDVTSLFTVKLSNSYSDIGTEVAGVWKSGDRCAFFSATGDGTKFTAPVLVDGSSSGDFRVNLPSAQASGMIALAYPAEGDFSFDGNNLTYTLPSAQNGVLQNKMVGLAQAGDPAKSRQVELKNGYCVVFLYVGKELGSVKSAEFKSKNGTGISGNVSYNLSQRKYSATESSVKVEYQTALECKDNTYIPLMVAPVTISGGYEASVTTGSGEVVKVESDQTMILTSGGKQTIVLSGSAPVEDPTALAICGDNMVYFIHPDAGSFKESVYWSIDLKDYASQLGLKASRCDHVDECKVVDNGTKLLLTSSYSFAALIDIETKKLLWCTNRCPNAHSAVLLPNDRVAVATSSGDDTYHRKVLIYDLSKNHQELYKTEVRSCHAVIWDEKNQRLHASGLHETDNSTGAVFSFKLKDWDTSSPSLELDSKGYTVAATKSLHDAIQVDDNTLMVGGNQAWFYSLTSGKFTLVPHFSKYGAIKSLNYNPETGECWYTAADNDVPVPDKDSSTRILCYTNNINGQDVQKTVEIPQDVYKVRVINW